MFHRVQALRVLNQRIASESDPDKRMILRVASQWLTASMKAEYDLFFRIQILEGVKGIHVGNWWKKGKRALPAIKEAFAGDNIDPSWFDVGSINLFNIITAACERVISSYKAPLEPFDFLSNALMGIALNPKDVEVLPLAHQIGLKSSSRIESGLETPVTIAKGPLSTFLVRKVMNVVKKFREQPIPQDEEGREQEFEDVVEPSFENAGAYLYWLIFKDTVSPLSKLIQDKIWKVWSNPDKHYHYVMPKFLEEAQAGKITSLSDFINKTPLPSKKDPNVEITTAKRSYFDDLWFPAWKDFFNAFKQDSRLLKLFIKEAEDAGIPVDPQDPIPFNAPDPIDAIKIKRGPRKPKKVPLESVAVVASRWIQGHSFSC